MIRGPASCSLPKWHVAAATLDMGSYYEVSYSIMHINEDGYAEIIIPTIDPI